MLRLILDTSTDQIYIKDIKSRFLLANQRTVQVLGAKNVEDLLGKTDFDFHPRAMAEKYRADEEALFASGQALINHEEPIVDQLTGEERWLSTNKIPFRDSQGQVAGLVGINRDITALRRSNEALEIARKQLAQAEKMESVGQLAAGVAHDFNNLLASLLAMNEMLLLKIPEGDPLRTFPENIERAGKRAADLVCSLLAFGRRQLLKPEVIDLRKLLAEEVTLLEGLLGRKFVVQTFLDGPPLLVNVDAGQISQVVMNLVSNARDAMEGGGTVSIGTGSRPLPASGDEREWAFFSVQDNGPGISEEIQERIFEPFFTTKDIGAGTGMGLSVVLGIVEQHQGRIALESAPGQGALFTVYLPIVFSGPPVLQTGA